VADGARGPAPEARLLWLTLGGERRARGAEASSLRAVAGSRPDGRGPLRRIEEGRDSAGQGAG